MQLVSYLLLLLLFATTCNTTTITSSSTLLDTTCASTENTMSKVVLITGANRGIGRALVQHLLTEYPDVHVILASRSLSNGQKTAAEILQSVADSNNNSDNRLEVVEMDTSSDVSVEKAAEEILSKHSTLYGVVNNAGIAWGNPGKDIVNVNYFGVRRVNNALLSHIQQPGGRIVHVGSAAGPMWLAKQTKKTQQTLSEPWNHFTSMDELDKLVREKTTNSDSEMYGFSKAMLHAYTALLAKEFPRLIINAVTPGFIASDMGKSVGATKSVDEGAIPLAYLLMSPDLDSAPTGRYYGSDCKRSPLDEYRGPGDPVFDGPDWK